MSETPMPALPEHCFPVNWAADPKADALPPEVKEVAAAFAGMTLRSLTGWQVGGCPITVTPRRVWTSGKTWITTAPGNASHYFPRLRGGMWINGGPCSGTCPKENRIPLPGPVWGIESITIDGQVLDSALYHVEGDTLVRDDGEAWPLCSSAWQVVYLNAAPVDGLGAWVAGILAGQFAKALQRDSTCKLPAGTTSVVRAGLSFEVAVGTFEGGVTGIREVDAWVRSWNPHHLSAPVVVSSPDYHPARQTTWRA